MKNILGLVTLTFISSLTFGQTDYGFGAGQIITKNGDTLKCLVELAVTYGKKIAYKKSQDGIPTSIPTKEIRTITTPYKYYENIQIEKKERLMGLMVDGKARLFNHVIINEGKSQQGNGGSYQMYQAPTVTYVIMKDGKYFEVKKKEFKEVSGQLFSNCPTLVEKINNKTYKFDDLEKVTTEYNSCE